MAQQAPGQQLNDLLVTRNFDPQALDASGKPAPSPDQATVFSFDYTGESGKDYGTVVVMLGENNDMSVYFGDNVGKSMEGDDKKEWFDFLYQLRQFAKRNLLTFSLQNLNKLKYSMQGQAALKEGLFESWMGNKTNSWNGAETEARLMIKHKKQIKEGDARFRYIESLFIETAEGERYKLPFKSLTAGRAMLEHVKQGGKPYDPRGQHIVTLVNEMNLLSRFKRANQGKIFEGETAHLVVEAMEYHNTLHHTLKSLSTKTGYKKYFESWNPADINDEDVIIEDLRHMFVEQNIDSRIEDALPLLAKLKQETAMKEINVFEGWVNLLSEGTWALPDTPEKQQQLITLLSQELPVGPDATNATELLYDLIGDDDLFDQLHALAQEDANADARTIVVNKLEQMKSNPAVAQVIGKLKIEQTPQPEAPVEQPVQESVVCETCKCQSCECDDEENIDEQIQRIAELAGDFKDRWEVGYRPRIQRETTQKELDDLEHEDEDHNLHEPKDMRDPDLEEAGGMGMQRVFKNGQWVKPEPVKEVTDTVKFGPDGKPVAWSHEGDWEKTPKRNGKPVDPRGEVTNMAGRELQRAKQIANLEEDEDSGVERVILNRIMMAHPDLLQQFGPEAIMNAAREEAEFVGDVDEIGSSDVSAWVNNVVRNLENADHDATWNLQHGKEELGELSPNTLKSYIKKAGSSSHERSASNLASRAADKLANAHLGAPGEDDGSWDDEKSYIRSKGIARAVDKLEELSNDTVNSYKEKAWDEFAQGNDKRGAGIGRAIAKQRGEFGHVKTTNNQLDELSPDTLKSYINKASYDAVNKGAEFGSRKAAQDEVNRFTNRHMADTFGSRDKIAKMVGGDQETLNKVQDKMRGRVKGISKATSRLEELSPNTLKSYAKDAALDNARRGNTLGYLRGKPTKSGELEKDIGDKIARRQQGINKAINRLEEGGMSEVDILLQDLARGNVDMYAIYAHPKTNVEKFVSDQIHDRVEELTRERPELMQDDDIDRILEIIQMDLEDEYGIAETDAAQALANETVGGGNWLEEGTSLQGQYGHSGKLQTVTHSDPDIMDRIKFLAGLTK